MGRLGESSRESDIRSPPSAQFSGESRADIGIHARGAHERMVWQLVERQSKGAVVRYGVAPQVDCRYPVGVDGGKSDLKAPSEKFKSHILDAKSGGSFVYSLIACDLSRP